MCGNYHKKQYLSTRSVVIFPMRNQIDPGNLIKRKALGPPHVTSWTYRNSAHYRPTCTDRRNADKCKVSTKDVSTLIAVCTVSKHTSQRLVEDVPKDTSREISDEEAYRSHFTFNLGRQKPLPKHVE